jgi:murein DD-endopeptidase MepM/ murein hydrolase activator NlpD
MKKLQPARIYLFISAVIFFSACAEIKTGEPLPLAIMPPTVCQGSAAFLILNDQEAAKAEAYKDNTTISFYRDNATAPLRALIGIDLDEPPGSKELRVSIVAKDGKLRQQRIPYTVLTRKYCSQHLTFPGGKGVPGQQIDERFEREKEIVEKILARTGQEKLWRGFFIRPIAGEITTDFGTRRFINEVPKKSHTGIDIKAPAGTPIAASADGRVLYTGRFSLSGNSVFIDHGTGICTMYFHLASFAVQSGQKVKRGDIIGAVGSTGRSTGPHLHWGVRVNNKRVDPLKLVALFKGDKSTTNRVAGFISP